MKLILVERENNFRTALAPKISFSQKGTIYINGVAMKSLGITSAKSKLNIDFYQDELEHQKWYVLVHDKGNVTIHGKGKKDASGQTFASDICKKIINAFYHTSVSALKFEVLDPITFEGKNYYPLQLIKKSLVMDIPNPNGRAKQH